MTRVAVAEPWHTLSSDEVHRRLATSDRGLDPSEAASRLRDLGPNELPAEREAPLWRVALDQVRDPLVYILLAAAAVTLALRDYTDTGVILVVVAINATIGFVQERRARVAMRALERLSSPRATVVRDGEARDVPSRELVPGDVVLLTSGDRLPADLRLTRATDLSIDESLLTGESVAAEKDASALTDPALVAGDQANIGFAGTTVVRGRGRGIVVRTGAATELGRIADAMRAVGHTPTPLERTFAAFGRRVGIAVVLLALVVLAAGLARGMAPSAIFLTAVALAVSAIPEGLPVVLTITLAVGVRRMARRCAIVRALPAVETLGSTTTIGSDKTGTLTRNEMTVRALWCDGVRFDVTGTGYAPDGRIEHEGKGVDVMSHSALSATLRGAVLASEADPAAIEGGRAEGDPTEIALHVAAAKGGVVVSTLHAATPERDVVPFESERKFSVSLRAWRDGLVEHMKGAPEVILARCDRMLGGDGVRPIERDAALAAAAAMAADGLRVLAVAERPASSHEIAHESLGAGFALAGLVGMEDPVRDESAAAVADAHAAGIRVLMLTGDHLETARAIGQKLGLGDRALAGHEIDRLSDEELDLALRDVRVFARVTPEHKLRVVQRLQAVGEVVAVTGDGINDAPALRAAHLGIAMGRNGSDVAREASDMVLADDNFATITAAIEEGRVVFANVRKVTFFLLSTAAGEILAVLVSVLAGWPLPFTAAQILWINLVTDSLQVMALSFEPGEPGLLRHPPRPRREGVLTRAHLLRLLGVGAVMLSATLAMFWWTLESTGDMTLARTVAVTQMVVMQFYHVFNCRSLDRSIVTISLLSNRFLFASMVAVTLAHLAALYIPPLAAVLHFTPLDATTWGRILLVGLVVIVGGELDKLLNRRLNRTLG